jgi:hypothetical protein
MGILDPRLIIDSCALYTNDAGDGKPMCGTVQYQYVDMCKPGLAQGVCHQGAHYVGTPLCHPLIPQV